MPPFLDEIVFPELEFEPPSVDRHEVDGVSVLLLQDNALPLATVYAYFRGGYGLFDRDDYAAAMGLPALMRYGGTVTKEPSEVDEALEFQALQVAFGSSGGSVTSSMNALTAQLPEALELWAEMLAEPGFDQAEIDAWRGRQLESVLRRVDDPGRLAFSEMNLILFGDHPIGWEMDSEDLAPERVAPSRFQAIHERVICRDNLVLGVAGDVVWDELAPRLSALIGRLRPCVEPLPEAPVPEIRRDPAVFLIEKEIEQAVIVMAHPSGVRLADDPSYFSATIANSILGGGGFSSRILGRVRTEEGYAYSASSIWTTPSEHEGVVGATTRTRPENTVPAIRAILETMSELRDAAPSTEEVATTVDQIVNGFVFNFDTAGQIVSRTMSYMAQDLPDDWLERYVRGVQEVRPEAIQAVFREHLHPDRMTILVVGDPDRIGPTLETLGPVTVREVGQAP